MSINCDDCCKQLIDLENRVKELECWKEAEVLGRIAELKAEIECIKMQEKLRKEYQICIDSVTSNPIRF